MIVETVFFTILNQMEFHLVQNRKEKRHHGHIPFNVKGNRNIVFSVQMAEALTAHASNIEKWADERGLAISVPKSTVTIFTPDFAQSNTYPQVTLNNSILPLEESPRLPGTNLDPHFKFNAHVKPIFTWVPIIN